MICTPRRANRQSVLALMTRILVLTCPTPMVNLKGLLREYEESNSWRVIAFISEGRHGSASAILRYRAMPR